MQHCLCSITTNQSSKIIAISSYISVVHNITSTSKTHLTCLISTAALCEGNFSGLWEPIIQITKSWNKATLNLTPVMCSHVLVLHNIRTAMVQNLQLLPCNQVNQKIKFILHTRNSAINQRAKYFQFIQLYIEKQHCRRRYGEEMKIVQCPKHPDYSQVSGESICRFVCSC